MLQLLQTVDLTFNLDIEEPKEIIRGQRLKTWPIDDWCPNISQEEFDKILEAFIKIPLNEEEQINGNKSIIYRTSQSIS